MADRITTDHEGDGVDRRGFLKCMAWAGTGLVWSVSGGVLSSRVFGQGPDRSGAGSFSFVQISDSHIGFAKEANKNVIGTLEATVDKINALKERPDLLIHTGDLTHLSTPKEFDTVAEILKGAKVGQIVYVPGEHDIIGDSKYLKRFGAGDQGRRLVQFQPPRGAFRRPRQRRKPGDRQGLGILGTSSWTGSRQTWRAWPAARPSSCSPTSP